MGSYCKPGRGPLWRAKSPRSLAGASPGRARSPSARFRSEGSLPNPLAHHLFGLNFSLLPHSNLSTDDRGADGQIKGSEGLHRGGARAESLGLNVMISRPPRLRERAASLRTSEVSSLTYPPLAPPLFSCLNFRAIPASAGVTRTGSSRAAIIRSAQTSSRPARRVCGR